MKVGVQINRFDYPAGDENIGESLRDIAVAADESGFDSIWVMDHFFQIGYLGPYTDPMLEAYTTLGYLAGVTKRAKLGTMVTGVIYREPALLIKAVTTLDVLSGGRAYFGIGAGWNDQEAKALGLIDPLNSKRFSRLEDTLQLAQKMWSGDSSPFEGKVYTVPEPYNRPQAITKPHPPILIGGGGEEKTLRLVAQYGDACNLFARDMDAMVHKLEVLKKHCEEIGRNYDDIEKTALGNFDITSAANDPDAVIKDAEVLKSHGIQHVIYRVSNDANPESYRKLANTVERLHSL